MAGVSPRGFLVLHMAGPNIAVASVATLAGDTTDDCVINKHVLMILLCIGNRLKKEGRLRWDNVDDSLALKLDNAVF